MDLGLAGRTAIVCASTSGLGEATARALAAEGARVVVSGRRATEALGPVDVLVLNSGGPPPSRAATVDAEAIGEALVPLLYAQQRLVSLVLPGMRERGWGRIVAIESVGVVAPIAGLALSNLGRAAMGGYLKTLAGEVAADGVTVNLALPGRIATARTEGIDGHIAEQEGISAGEVEARAAARIPAGRYGTAAEFGAVTTFLCSAAASYVTGSALRCDGGLVESL